MYPAVWNSLHPCSADDLEHRYRRSHDPVERTHWHMLWLVAQEYACPTVATMVGSFEDGVRNIVHQYNAAGHTRGNAPC